MSRKKNKRGMPENLSKTASSRNVPGKGNYSSFLNLNLDTFDIHTMKRHLFILVLISLTTKILIAIITPALFHSGLDMFDFQYYSNSMVSIANGQIPYIDFGFDYPPLALVPILIAFIPAIFTHYFFAFVYSFQVLMILCDTITVISVYFIGLKIYNQKTAFIAAALYGTAFSGAYFVLTKYDAFPTCLLMIAVLFTLYGMNARGYIAGVLGFLAKIYPAIALPFMILYNSKKSSLKQEIWTILKIGIPIAIILLIPILLLKPGALLTYFSGSLVRSDVYVNTATHTIYAFFEGVFHFGVSETLISNLMYLLMGMVLVFLIILAWIVPEKNSRQFLKFLLISIFSVVFCMKYHSPQYVMWFTPFVCLLVADSLSGIIAFYFTQVLTYLEFPLMFGFLYTNGEYLNPAGTYGWFLALFFFTIEYGAYLLLVYLAVQPTILPINQFREFIRCGFQKS